LRVLAGLRRPPPPRRRFLTSRSEAQGSAGKRQENSQVSDIVVSAPLAKPMVHARRVRGSGLQAGARYLAADYATPAGSMIATHLPGPSSARG